MTPEEIALLESVIDRAPMEAEITAMQAIAVTFKDLDPLSIERVLAWAKSRYERPDFLISASKFIREILDGVSDHRDALAASGETPAPRDLALYKAVGAAPPPEPASVTEIASR